MATLGTSVICVRKRLVDMKTTGAVTIIEARPWRFLVTAIKVIPRTRSGTGTGATLNFGSNSSAFDNVVGSAGDSTAVGGVNFVKDIALPDSEYLVYCDLTASGLRVNITLASTYTTETADVFVFGFQEES